MNDDPLGLNKLDYDQILRRPSDLMDLTGRTAAVTGAGGSGLGQAIANRLAAQGAAVAIIDIDGDGATRVASEIESRWGTRAVPMEADVSNWDHAHRVVGEVVDALGSIDIWVNNVGGIGVVAKTYVNQSKEEIDRVVASTFTSTLYSTHAVLQTMVAQNSGRIINISSEGSKMGIPLASVYGTCKSAVNGFTQNLAQELPEHNISIVAVCPGYMMSEGLRYGLDHPEEFPDLQPLLLDNFSRVTLGRSALPEEVANLVAFLASRAGAYAHGTAISFGGGMSD